MKQYGCIGKKLTHSFSKEIHAKLADYNYELIETILSGCYIQLLGAQLF